ncbi:hypothetical protein GCM10023322_45330 [Rugosimonospora acidiphila]|uniref:Major facilitator superfamily (MFS) profile domain-containing protein n=1 Tax=Rugosimonospora acidiphila TaxID=556531 RepID=A0ABP9S4B7_9ACTN
MAIAAAFMVHGAVSGGLAARLPAISGHLGLSATTLGVALLMPAVGSVSTMPFTGWVVHRLGARSATRLLLTLWGAALVLPALAGNLWTLVAAFVVYGAAAGSSDVAMNAQAVEIERRAGRSIMSGLHGLWSVGSFAGSGVGALAALFGVGYRPHLTAAAIVLVLLAALAGHALPETSSTAEAADPARDPATRDTTPVSLAAPGSTAPSLTAPGSTAPGSTAPGLGRRSEAVAHDIAAESQLSTAEAVIADPVIAEPAGAGDPPAPRRFSLPTGTILLLGLVAFCAAFAEGSGMDWSAVYLNRVSGASQAVAASAYTTFACVMAIMRFSGDWLVGRIGPVRTVRAGGVLAVAGGVLIVAARGAAPAFVGFALLGAGVATVIPLAFTAAGRIGPHPGQAIAGVATVSYGASLVGPGLIGAIAGAASLPVAFTVVALLCVFIALGAGLMRRDA